MSVFISYRREDSAYSLLVFHRLCEEFGEKLVFRDVERIAAGQDFVAAIEVNIRKSTALVAVVGKGWVRRRKELSNPRDFVRRELLLALKNHLALYPLLVGGTTMPQQWPPALRGFARTNAIPVTDYRFDSDLQTVVDALRPTLGRTRPQAAHTAGGGQDALDTVNRLEVQAVESLERGDPAGARRTLDEGWDLLMAARAKSRPGPEFDVHLGYLYKASAQISDAAGDTEQAQHHIGLAANLFSGVIQRGEAGTASVVDLANAVNGMGNVHSFCGQLEEAIADYRRAVAVAPNYAYAWHDLALTYVDLARSGRFDREGMREAVVGLKNTGMDVETLGPERIEFFEGELARLEREAGD